MARTKTLPLWQALLLGPFLIAMGIWEYERLADFDASGGTIVLDRFTAGLYRLGGKNTVLVIIVGIGIAEIAMLAYWWRTTRAAEQKLAAMSDELAPPELPKERPLRQRGEGPVPVAPPADGGPFRGGPVPTVQVIRTERPATRPEVVPGGGDDRGPSILR